MGCPPSMERWGSTSVGLSAIPVFSFASVTESGLGEEEVIKAEMETRTALLHPLTRKVVLLALIFTLLTYKLEIIGKKKIMKPMCFALAEWLYS